MKKTKKYSFYTLCAFLVWGFCSTNVGAFDLLGITRAEVFQIFGDLNCIKSPIELLTNPESLQKTVVLTLDEPEKLFQTEPQYDTIEKLDVKFKEDVGCEETSGNSTCSNLNNPVSLINELAQYNKIPFEFKLIGELGFGIKKRFVVKLQVGNEEYEADGSSVKLAQQSVAKEALFFTKFEHPPVKASTEGVITPTVELNNIAAQTGQPISYEKTSFENNNFYVNLMFGAFEFFGKGISIKSARHDAARKALNQIQQSTLPFGSSQVKSPISEIYEFKAKHDVDVYFEVVEESGPPHKKTFITECRVGDYVTVGEGRSKKLSKRHAAEQMIPNLQNIPQKSRTNQRKGKKSLVKEAYQKEESLDLNKLSKVTNLKNIQEVTDFVGGGNIVKNIGNQLLRGFGGKNFNSNSLSLGSLAKSMFGSKRRRRGRGKRNLSGVMSVVDKINQTIPFAKIKDKALDAVEKVKDYLKIGDQIQSPESEMKEAKPDKIEATDSDLSKVSSDPHNELIHLSKILNFQTEYFDVPKGGNEQFLSIVSINTDTMQICKGSGDSLKEAHAEAALNALQAIAEMGLYNKIRFGEKESDVNLVLSKPKDSIEPTSQGC